jgi:hypothetical protein
MPVVRLASGVSFLLAWALLENPFSCHADGVVTTCTESALRSALIGGGQVTFACDGVISLSDVLVVTNDTLLDATGHDVTVSGSNSTRLFRIDPGVRLVVENLTLADGLARGTNSTVDNGAGGPGAGGAILNDHATLEAIGCVFRGNRALGGTGGPGVSGTIAINRGGDGMGGAIFNDSGIVRLTNVVFDGNMAQGGRGGDAPSVTPSRGGSGGASIGGAICSSTGMVTLTSCRFISNSAPASLPGPANGFNPSSGPAYAGAIYDFSGVLQIADSRFENQFCGGGDAFCTGSGGAIYQAGGVLAVTGCVFATNRVVGGNGIIIGIGGNSGNASGGAMYLIYVSPPNQEDLPIPCVAGVTNSLFVGNEVEGGIQAPAFSPAGYGYGGAFYNGGHLTLLNCTLAANSATGGAVVEPGYPISSAYGGAIYTWYNRATSTLTHVTFAGNQARYGTGAGIGSATQGGGILVSGGVVHMQNSLLADNAGGANGVGTLVDDGNNISSDASCAFTAPGSRNNTDPMLLPLAQYGGPTLTMALRPGSPAIDAGKTSFCPVTDQRGALRPQNGACDIGAFEATFLSIRKGLDDWVIEHVGVPNSPCTLQTSANLRNWLSTETLVADDAGRARFTRSSVSAEGFFFRTVFP